MRPDVHLPALVPGHPIAAVLRVVEGLLDVDVHPTDRVDHLDEPAQVDRRVVVDRDPEERPDRVLEGPHPSGRELVLVGCRVAQQAVEFRREGPAVTERDVD